MVIAKVVKRVVSTIKNEVFEGYSMLLVQPLNMSLKAVGAEVLCVDLVGAGLDELVMIMKEGSGVNDLMGLKEAPSDAAIVGIVDQIILDDKATYDKSQKL
jgi:microcompartment protein CcmK/EutM